MRRRQHKSNPKSYWHVWVDGPYKYQKTKQYKLVVAIESVVSLLALDTFAIKHVGNSAVLFSVYIIGYVLLLTVTDYLFYRNAKPKG